MKEDMCDLYCISYVSYYLFFKPESGSIFSLTPQRVAEINNRYLVHKSILKSVARAFCLCSPQLQLGQFHGWWLNHLKVCSAMCLVAGAYCWSALWLGQTAGTPTPEHPAHIVA